MGQENVKGISLSNEVRKRGATDAQLNSKIFKLAERAVAEECVDGFETASDLMSEYKREIKSSVDEVKYTASQVRGGIASAKNITERLERATTSAERTLRSINVAADSVTISDKNLMDAVNVYTLILSRTKEVLGEERLTENVLVQLLETASYGLWRSVMGPKDGNSGRRVV